MVTRSLHVRWLVSVLAAVALLVAACGGGSPTPTPAPPPTPTEIPLIDEPDDAEDVEADDAAMDDADAEATPEPAEEADADVTPEPVEEADADATPEPAEEADPAATPEPDEVTDDMDDDGAMMEDEAFLASITLPDGTECLHAGRGATRAFDGMRLNYTCMGDDEGGILLGDMSTRLDLLTVTYGVMSDDADELETSEEIEMRMAEVTLADGTVCLNSGQGATPAFDEQRVNFSCGEGEEADDVLLGDMELDMDVLTATRGMLTEGDDGFELGETETVYVTAVVGAEAD